MACHAATGGSCQIDWKLSLKFVNSNSNVRETHACHAATGGSCQIDWKLSLKFVNSNSNVRETHVFRCGLCLCSLIRQNSHPTDLVYANWTWIHLTFLKLDLFLQLDGNSQALRNVDRPLSITNLYTGWLGSLFCDTGTDFTPNYSDTQNHCWSSWQDYSLKLYIILNDLHFTFVIQF